MRIKEDKIMIVNLEDSKIIIDGKSVFRGFVVTYIIVELCKAVYRAEKRYSAKLDAELKQIKKDQKLAKKNSKKQGSN